MDIVNQPNQTAEGIVGSQEPQKPVTPVVSQPPTRPEEKRGKIVSIVSVKGGVGKTTLAANLGILLAREFALRCLVVDGDLHLPGIGFHLDILDPDVTLHDVLKGEFSITQAVYVHDYGLHVIPGSVSEENVSSKGVKEGIMQLSRQYDWVVIDTMPCLDEDAKNIISSSNEVLIVSSPDFPSITASLKAIKLAREMNLPVRGVVLNKVRGKDYELSEEEIEETLSLPILAAIPEDPKVYESLSKRKPVVIYAPKSPASRELRKLAQALIGGKKQGKGPLSRLLESLRMPSRR